MPDVGEVRYKVTVDSSGLNEEIAKTEKKIGGLGDPAEKTSRKFTGLGKAGVKALKGIGAAFVGLTSAAATGVAAVAKMGIEYNSQMQSYQAAFSTMLGDAEKAQRLTNDLKEMAASTPLAMTDLADASQTLLAFGVSSEKLLPTLKNLGDVALGDSEKMQSLALAFGQMSSTGKLTGQDLLQMINAGFNPLNEISKMTGKSVAELKEEMSDGAISADMVAEAFAHATSEGGQFYNAMEEQSKTFDGQMSTLKDNIAGLTGTLTEDLFAGLAENTLPKVNEWVEELTTAAEEGGVEGAIEASGTILTEAITSLLNGAPKLINTATSLVGSFLQGVKDNGPQIVEGGINVIMSLLSGFIDTVPDLIESAGVLIASLISGLADHLPEVIQMAVRLVVAIVEGLLRAAPQIVMAAAKLVQSMLTSFLEIDWIELGKDVVRGIIDGLVSMGSALWDAAKNLARKALDSMLDFFDINSPSKKVRDRVGKPIGEGLVKGLEEGPDVESAGRELSRRAFSGLTADVNYNLPNVSDYAKSLTADFAQSYHSSTEITVPLYLDGREVARASAWWTGEQLSWEEM